ncbi:phosphate-starvation-inducible PsiE family protein [Methylophaga sp.]|uniref:phosphate-starvation-inducible PsiE family protein n=1 Tax=Methylophaga sp. TaxID=2024840 RepID=UPI001401B3A5|nr:phosphate-starvation-inducible PsiE family protein [Methylophaga sp.]MTI64483.1 hypothetical protein [Methylophaga sp.]
MLKKLLPEQWAIMTFYQRFETIMALVLTCIVTFVVLVAMYRLTVDVISELILKAHNPLQYVVFQRVFGEIMTVLIALEFNHTLQYVVTRQQSIIQTKVIILIALLAVSRKFIILDIHKTEYQLLVALGVVTIALGVVYWLLNVKR